MDAINQQLADSLEEELALPMSPADEVERMADVHRRAMATYMKRSADARKLGKTMVAELEDERRHLKERFREDMARLDDEVAATKAATAERIAAAEKLAAVSRTALEALTA